MTQKPPKLLSQQASTQVELKQDHRCESVSLSMLSRLKEWQTACGMEDGRTVRSACDGSLAQLITRKIKEEGKCRPFSCQGVLLIFPPHIDLLHEVASSDGQVSVCVCGCGLWADHAHSLFWNWGGIAVQSRQGTYNTRRSMSSLANVR